MAILAPGSLSITLLNKIHQIAKIRENNRNYILGRTARRNMILCLCKIGRGEYLRKERNKKGKKDEKNHDSLLKEFHLKIQLITIKVPKSGHKILSGCTSTLKEDVIGRIEEEKKQFLL